LVEHSTEGARRRLRAEVVWLDHFGNLQLAVPGRDGPPLAPRGAPGVGVEVRVGDRSFPAHRVAHFSALGPGEVGVLVDSTGRLALVVREGSAAAVTGAGARSVVELVW
ncbi:MAG: SAM hydroxide adenosyltransferase, partial [Acidimicrobiales bacterium]